MVVVKQMEVDNCNCDFASRKKLKCCLRSIDTCIMDYETNTTLGHELCQRLSGHLPEDLYHRKKAIFLLRNSQGSCVREEPNKQTKLPDVVLSCSNDEKSPKLTPEVCGRVLSHIADHFEIDRRKRASINQKPEKSKTCSCEDKKLLIQQAFSKRIDDITENIKNTDEHSDSLSNAEMTNTSEERKSTLCIEFIFKSILQRVLEEILFCK